MAENTQSPVTIDSAQSLINLANNTQPIQQPYQYGNLGLTTSDYSLWGSKGNPYMTGGPGYNPGTRWGTPINPQPIAPIAPPSNGGGDSSPIPDWVDPSTPIYNEDGSEYDPKFDDYPWQNSKVLGDLAPGAGLAYGLINGRIDNPYGEGYARLPWYEGSAGGGYGYTEEGYDQYAPGDVDRGIYSNYYDANGNLVSERGWDDSFDDYNTGDNWANTGFWEGMGNIIGGRTWDGLEEPATFGDPASDLAKQSDAAITQAEAAKQAEKQAVAQAKLDEISKYTGMLQGEFDAQMAAQEDLNAGQIELMTQIKGDMQRDFGDFTTQNSQQMAQMAAENASMFDSIEEYRAWQLDTDAHQQSWMENQFKDQAATQNDLNSTQTDLMNQIAMDMQGTYGEFSGQMGEQLANMAAENASMFDNFAEYKQWMGESFTTLESGLNEQLAQQAAVNEGLNSNQIDLMNSIAEDMRNDYGDFESGINGQLEQMAAENASMFDSLEEYQQWMSDNNATAPATPSNPPPSTVADAVKAGKPFGKEGDDTWSPDGKNVYHGPGHNWNTPDSENKAPPGTVTPPPSSGGDDGYGDSSGGGGGWEGSDAHSDMDEDSGWSGADSDFDDSDSGGGDSGGGGGGGSYIATASTQALGEEGLSVFNNWRDYMSTWHPTFKTSYGRYRVTAPKIVAEIDKRDNSKELYREIWDKHLKPIYGIIKQDMNDEKALVDYKVMVKELMNKYLKGVK